LESQWKSSVSGHYWVQIAGELTRVGGT